MDTVPPVIEPRAKERGGKAYHFTGTLGAELRAIRVRRRRMLLELLAIAGGALLLGILFALFLAK